MLEKFDDEDAKNGCFNNQMGFRKKSNNGEMFMFDHPGARLHTAIVTHKPLIVAGVINAFCALLAEKAKISAIYLSGAGVANACYGLPDLGMTSLENVAEEVRRIVYVCSLPLIVDADTGWGNSLMIEKTVKVLESAGAAALHIEDQRFEKRCGHRDGKKLVSKFEMVERIKAAKNARKDPSFMIIARTDAIASEGIDDALERGMAYKEAGADILFVEAATKLTHYQRFKDACGIPILANLTEFGKTPSWTAQEVAQYGVDIALFPLSAFRAMNLAAEKVYNEIAANGSTKEIQKNMQTRTELYSVLNYTHFEQLIDAWMDAKGAKDEHS